MAPQKAFNKKPFIIGITGGSGSGKTFFLKSFLHHFETNDVTLLSQDDYYIPVGEMTPEENKIHNFDLPQAIDAEQFLADIKKLMNGEVVFKQAYNFNNPATENKVLAIKPAPILIVEGLFTLHFAHIATLLNLSIFIGADENIALQRRIKRDAIERGYPVNDVLYKWHHHVVPSYQTYLLPYRDACHKVFLNNLDSPHEMIEFTKSIAEEIKAKDIF